MRLMSLAVRPFSLAAWRCTPVPTIRFQILHVFLALAHNRRRILHFGVTAHPTAEWTAQQLRNVFPRDTAARCLLRDRERAHIARVIGSIRRECLDHMIV